MHLTNNNKCILRDNKNFRIPLGVNLNVKKGELIAVVGPVACGKTTLLMTILRELEHSGTLNINGKVGFSSQVPWIFNGETLF